ncbi:MAG TPA: O-antigen ligase family protein, partial [Polyangiaceae bacterium]|nr:O-antigen ligase family protein [Polyangiaceae bacterium]
MFAAAGFAVLSIGSVVAIGSVHLWAVLTAASIGLGLALFVAWNRGSLPAPSWVLLGLAAYTIVQSVPLPVGLVSVLAPQNADAWQRLSDLLGQGVVASLSLDPGASWVEASKWALYAGVFSIAAFVGRRQGPTTVLGVVFGAAMAVAVLTLGHKVVGATKLYGIYEPKWAHPNFALAPLLNTNNLAGYLNLGAFVGVGLFMSRPVERMRWLTAVGVSLVVAVSALGASRGGWASLAIGVVLLAIVLLRFARARGAFQWVMLAPLVAIAAGMGLFYSAVSGRVLQMARGESLKKLDLISWTKPMIADHPWFGVGRGAFESTFPRYRQDTGYHAYQYAENVAAQWMVEWGMPVALVGATALVVSCWPAIKRSRISLASACALLGVFVLVVHNMFDLAFEVASVCIAVFGTLGGIWGASDRTHERDEPNAPRYRRAIAMVALTFVAGAPVAVILATGAHESVSDRDEVTRTLNAVEQGDA